MIIVDILQFIAVGLSGIALVLAISVLIDMKK